MTLFIPRSAFWPSRPSQWWTRTWTRIRRATRATAYLQYLYSPEGQEIAAKNYYRPRLDAVAKKYAGQFPPIKLFTVDKVFGGLQRRAENALCRWRHL